MAKSVPTCDQRSPSGGNMALARPVRLTSTVILVSLVTRDPPFARLLFKDSRFRSVAVVNVASVDSSCLAKSICTHVFSQLHIRQSITNHERVLQIVIPLQVMRHQSRFRFRVISFSCGNERSISTPLNRTLVFKRF